MSDTSKSKQLNSLDLQRQYNWFATNFMPKIVKSSNDFFGDIFSIHLISISENINILAQGSNYFVTKVRVDKKNNVFLRCSEDTIELILNRILGFSRREFSLENLSELEAKIITSFNDYVYESISQFIKTTPACENYKDIDLVHLTLFIKEKEDEAQEGGKIIISIPTILLNPENVVITS